MKRLYSLDIYRGSMIILVIIFHRFLYDWTITEGFFLSEQPWVDYPWLTLFMIFVAMGSIFTLITGIVTTYSIYNRISSGKSKMKPLVLGSVVMLIWLALLGYVVRYFFTTRFHIRGEFYYGMYIGSLRFNTVYFPKLELVILVTSTLIIIGISGLVVTVLSALMFRNDGIEKLRRNKRIFGILSVIILTLSAFLPFILIPMMYNAFDNGNYVLAVVLALLVADYFPIFPILGFAFFGAILGLQLAAGEDQKKITNFWLRFCLIIVIIGVLLVAISISQGLFNFNFIRFIQLGFYFFIIVILLKTFDFQTEEKQEKRVRKTTPILRFGRVSLTIFVFETVIATTINFFIIDYLIPGWNNEIIFILLIGVFNLALWWVILIFWEKKNFKGSIEWISAQLVKKVAGKSSGKLK